MASFPFAFWKDSTGSVPVGLGYRYGYAFDGVDEQIDFPSHLTLDGNFSVSTWFKSTASGNENIIADWGSGTRAFQMRLSSNKIQVFTSSNGISSSDFIQSPLSYNTGDWYNAVFTWGPTGDGILYVNGVNVVSTTYSYYQIYQSSNNLIIGDNQFSGQNFTGRLDDIQVYDFELTPSQVSDIYNNGYVTAPTAGPIHHWKLGEEDTFSTNWTVKDSVGSLDGTSVNMEEVDRKLGVAYSLQADGVDELVNFGDINFNDGSQDMSFSFWVSGLGANMANGTVFGKEFAAYNGYRIFFNGNRQINFTIGTNYSTNQITKRTASLFNDLSAWFHIVVVFNSTRVASDCKIYVNNVESSVTINDDFTTLITDTGADFEMFNTTNGNFQHLNGAIMEFAKFDTILSASDVSLLFNETGTGNGVPIDPRNVGLSPTFYCPMVGPNDTYDGTNWTITDEIAGNNGTSVNMEEADKTSETP